MRVGARVTAVFLLTVASVMTGGPAHAVTYNLFHYNICGHVCEEGNDTRGSDQVVEALYRSLTQNEQEVAASLNEVCFNQFDKLRGLLEPHDWHGVFVKTKDKDDDPGLCGAQSSDSQDHNFGNAIFVHAPIIAGSVDITDLPDGDGGTATIKEHRKMICVTGDLTTDTRFCSVHIAPLSTWTTDAHTKQNAQIAAVRDKVESFNRPVVLMGDFNTPPGSAKLDKIYHAGTPGYADATGKFREVDDDTAAASYGQSPPCRCGAYTFSLADLTKKIDYIFFSAADFGGERSGSRATPTVENDGENDERHYILRGVVNI